MAGLDGERVFAMRSVIKRLLAEHGVLKPERALHDNARLRGEVDRRRRFDDHLPDPEIERRIVDAKARDDTDRVLPGPLGDVRQEDILVSFPDGDLAGAAVDL